MTIEERRTVIINNIEYEIEDHDKGLKFEDAVKKCPKGWRLWNVNDFNNFKESDYKKLNLIDCWFYIEQPLKINENKVAWFVAGSDWAYLDCIGVPGNSYSRLWVRFCKDLKKEKNPNWNNYETGYKNGLKGGIKSQDTKWKDAIKEIKLELCSRLIKNKPCGICVNCKTIDYETEELL